VVRGSLLDEKWGMCLRERHVRRVTERWLVCGKSMPSAADVYRNADVSLGRGVEFGEEFMKLLSAHFDVTGDTSRWLQHCRSGVGPPSGVASRRTNIDLP
jgi:hypothetical protein